MRSIQKVSFQAWLAVFALFVTFPLEVCAQVQDSSKQAIQNFSKDLAQLQQAVLDAQRKMQAQEQLAKFAVAPDSVVVTSPTSIRAGAADNAKVVFKASVGESYQVVDKADSWYAVLIPGAETKSAYGTGWVSAAAAAPAPSQKLGQSTGGTALAEQIYLDLTERAARLKETYKSNPYVSVTGFTVNILPPSLSVNFEFKK